MAPITTASANHPQGSRLDCAPETDTNPVNTNHTVTCTLEDVNNTAVVVTGAAVRIHGEVDCTDNDCANADYDGGFAGHDAGVNANQPAGTPDDSRTVPDGTCTIAQNASSCQITYDRNDAGTDELIFWVDEDTNAGTDDSDAGEVQGDEDDDGTDVVHKTWQDRVATNVDCEPNETNQTGTQHTARCTTTDQFGQPIAGAPGPTVNDPNNIAGPESCDPTTDANGQADCTFTNNGTPGTVTTTQCSGPGGTGACDTQTKTFSAGVASGLDAFPENDTNVVGQQHTITCQLFNQFGNQTGANGGGTQNQTCNFEFFTGSPSDQDQNSPNTPDRACTTNAQGTCSITYSSAAPGTDLVCAYLGGTQPAMAGTNTNGTCDGEGLTDPTGEQANQGDMTPATPNPAGDENTGAGGDDQDVVQKVWQAGAGAATQINAEPETATNPVGTSHTINVSARDANNNETQATPVLADITSGPSANQQTAQAEITCVNDTTGPPAGVSFLAGETQTHECTYTHAQFPNDVGGAGTDQIRVFADTNNNGRFDAGEPSDEVTKTWSGQAFTLTITPEADQATAGTCNAFTARVLDQQGNPVSGVQVDVQQILAAAGNDPAETREIAFCNPAAADGPNPTGGAGGAAFTPHDPDATTNPQGGNVGPTPANNTTVQAEVGPTSANGEVTFGITINQTTANATVNIRGWVDTAGNNADNDTFEAGEPTDTATKTWTPGGGASVTTVDAQPETATNPIGTQHQVTVTLTGASGAIQGVTPNSIIATNASGRQQGDVADPNAGNSPNATTGNFNVYNCTVSNAQGISTCTYQDNPAGPIGTDTIVFYVNQASGGTAGPDANEPQDAVQKTWTPGPTNMQIDLRCVGANTNDDQDVAEQNVGAGQFGGEQATQNLQNQNPDCTNPVSDPDEVFTAIVTNAQGIGQQNVRVDFSFANATGGNAQGTSANDATLASGAGGGGQVGTNPAGLTTFCLTDATGRCSVTLNNPTPVAGDTITVTAAISGGSTTQGQPQSDSATKQWQAGVVNQGGRITLTPPAATNQIGTQHTVTATVTNQFGQPVQGADVDFRITAGPNVGFVQAGMTDAVTNAQGQATFTYTSNVTGTDTIVACSETGGSENDNCDAGEPTATANKTWQTGPVTTNAVALDMDADDVAGTPVGNPGGCELTTSGADANRESTATNQIDPTPGGQLSAGNFHRICAAAFQTNQQGNQGRLAGATITFTIQGPGRIYAANANGQCSQAAQPAAGTTVTATANNNGIAFACLYSQQVGRTTVTATSGTPAQTATGTKDWTVSAATARFIQLCHGDVAGTTCDTAEAHNVPGDEHQFTARVTDAQGNPVSGVPVQFRETGPGIFTPQGGGSATVNTDANGLASVLLTSDVEGTSQVVAEIDPAGQAGPAAGPARGPGATNDQCEQPAGTNNQPAAGNCTSQTLTKVWEDEIIIDPQCDDGQDNDGDELVDLEDPGCVDDNDNSELPVNTPPERVRHGRSISIRFNDGTGARNNGLVVFGRLRATDGFNDCITQQAINIQRRINGRWITKKTTNTNRKGRYAVEIFDQASRYRAVAVRSEILDEDLNQLHVCQKAVKAKRHRHRR